ncbi:hypothetical protein [Ruminiclostridium cellobioparum]|uniref:Uncharacterized protein n=1 Tax=Ruminiclostridium cellobioparum subsp. termitidis CT1112 TaxID=1195236 RepID=S0FJJ2_RUMCE|nr:hypothetical protein [Ruminiclostridium cellobioparum]EMS72310.1 hypothetical protein CTER_1724 [Ruminiclostridium cellobioparum subsp. termitidis CT1112]
MNQRNRVLELLFFAVLSIIFIVLFFVNKPYDKKPVQIIQPAKTRVESQVNKYDAVSVQP